MVKLYLEDIDQLTTLDVLLDVYGILYERVTPMSSFGIKAPFLMVDGVPLDFDRSIKWIKGQCEHE